MGWGKREGVKETPAALGGRGTSEDGRLYNVVWAVSAHGVGKEGEVGGRFAAFAGHQIPSALHTGKQRFEFFPTPVCRSCL